MASCGCPTQASSSGSGNGKTGNVQSLNSNTNPFVHKLVFTWPRKLQFILASIFIAPIRALCILVCVLISYTFASIALLGRTKEDETLPLSGWRNALRPIIVFWARATFWCGGFYKIKVKGELAPSSVAPVLVLGPHSSFFDSVAFVHLNLTSMVAKSEITNLPLFGAITRYAQPVFVRREDPNSRHNTILEIQRRARTGCWPHIAMFPEGTCTNRKCLISFKPGAFYPGVPVQPVCLRYSDDFDTITWTWEGIGAKEVFWYTLCRLYTTLEIEYLPVYYPNEAEKKNPKLYAYNVREIMAKALGVPVMDHSHEDISIMNYSERISSLPASENLLDFNKNNRKVGLTAENTALVRQLIEHIKTTGETSVQSVSDLAGILKVDTGPHLKALYNVLDKDDTGVIDLRDYVMCLFLVTLPKKNEQIFDLAFELYADQDPERLTEEQFLNMFESVFGIERTVAQLHYSKIVGEKSITAEEIKTYALTEQSLSDIMLDLVEKPPLLSSQFAAAIAYSFGGMVTGLGERTNPCHLIDPSAPYADLTSNLGNGDGIVQRATSAANAFWDQLSISNHSNQRNNAKPKGE